MHRLTYLPYESAVVDLPVRAAGNIPRRDHLQLGQCSMSCCSAHRITLLGWVVFTCMHAAVVPAGAVLGVT